MARVATVVQLMIRHPFVSPARRPKVIFSAFGYGGLFVGPNDDKCNGCVSNELANIHAAPP